MLYSVLIQTTRKEKDENKEKRNEKMEEQTRGKKKKKRQNSILYFTATNSGLVPQLLNELRKNNTLFLPLFGEEGGGLFLAALKIPKLHIQNLD